MQNEQDRIRNWMVKAGQATPEKPTIPSLEVRLLRVKIIAEELVELSEALGIQLEIVDDSAGVGAPRVIVSEKKGSPEPNLVEAFDGICDIEVTNLGTGVALGLKIKPGFDEVMDSNDSKFIDGYRREDGKWMKGPSSRPPVLLPIIQRQLLDDSR